jgi:putative flavoprotein involved in K+ transport
MSPARGFQGGEPCPAEEEPVPEAVDTLVIGAGQAGLAMSHALAERGQDQLVVERGRVGERWHSERWDSLAFQFPNWSLRLPGLDYEGADPDGFSGNRDVAARIVEYATVTKTPVRTGVEVVSLTADGGGFRASTVDGVITARNVVLATGPYQRPKVPPLGRDLPPDVFQVHSSRYRNPGQLPPGAALVVGSGGSGGQIAEELARSGRTVYLAISRHRRVPRRRHDRDLMWWLLELGWMDRPVGELPGGRLPPTLLITGVDGGHDLDLRRLQRDGVVLLGRLGAVDGPRLLFRDDAAATLAAAEAGFDELRTAIDDHAREAGFDLRDDVPEPVPGFGAEAVTAVDLKEVGISSVVWCTGYAYDYDWVHLPCFANGAPLHQRGVSSRPGLYFLGLAWMHTFKSSVLLGVGADAAHLADHIAARR